MLRNCGRMDETDLQADGYHETADWRKLRLLICRTSSKMDMLSVHFIRAVSIIPLILHYLESQIDIAEMPYLSTVGFEPATGQMPTPDYIIPGIERKIDLDSVTFGGYAHQGRALPVSPRAAIIFCDHEGTVGHLRIPVGDYDSIEGLRLAYL